MTLRLHLQQATAYKPLPSRAEFRRWVLAALAGIEQSATTPDLATSSIELTIRLVDLAESTELNETYRQKQGPTNVLSFSFESPPGDVLVYLGDLVICAPLVATEARQQGKSVLDHFAHLTIHGILHLSGYDHETKAQANVMETLEITVLKRLGVADPYE